MTENQGDDVEDNTGDDTALATTKPSTWATMIQGQSEGASRNN